MLIQIQSQIKPLFNGESSQFALSVIILAFGLIISLGIFYVIIKKNQGWGNNSVRMVGLTLVLTASLFLITAGYSQEQITPVVGLLGTIIGYLLGSGQKKDAE